jgi:ligand-binding sensor domain-containing protein/serine phosphatase RsbU (regulator of sigma subunit)
MKFISGLLFCLIICLNTYAQQYYFANYTLDDGLPNSKVNAVIQDQLGYIWIATSVGVARFDGQNFLNFTTKDGLGDNKVTTLFETAAGQLLVGHENGKLSYWNKTHFESIDLEAETNRIFSITADKKGSIWIGTLGSGIIGVKSDQLIPHLQKHEYIRFDHTNGLARDVTTVMEDSDGTLWFVTDLGIKFQDPQTGEFKFLESKGIGVVQFSAIAEDGNKDLWVGTTVSGAYRFSKKLKTFTPYSIETGALKSNFISTLTRGNDGSMLIGTWGGGYSVYTKQGVESYDKTNGLPEDKVRCLMQDREGNIWIGTNQAGISCFRGKQFSAYLRSTGESTNQIGAIFEDSRHRMWFGSNTGVYVMEQGRPEMSKIELTGTSEELEVTSFLEDKDGMIWASTWGNGILLISPNDFSLDRFRGIVSLAEFSEKYVHTLKKDRKGRIWISMLQGITMFDPKRKTLKTFTKSDGIADNITTDIQEDRLGNIWIGSATNGLTIYEGAGFRKINSISPAIYPVVSSLTLDDNGILWVATEGGGIYSYDGKKFVNYTIKDKIGSNFVNLIEHDKRGKLWLGTNIGLSVYDPVKKVFHVIDKLDKKTRIETKSNSVLLDSKGMLWFGTINGVLKFDPSAHKTNPVESLTRINAVKVFQDTLRGNNLKLNYKRNYLSFYFSGICFSDPEEVRYKVQLEGLDSDWQEPTGLNFSVYNNLPPGVYTFKVKSCNNDGVWNKEAVSFSFEIAPPYWMTWWFYAGAALFVFLIIFLFIKFRERNLRIEKKHLEELVNERTIEIVEQKEEIENQRDELRISSALIEHKNLSIIDSIRYAKRIQLATLPYWDVIVEHFPDSFILYKPKDIVSGDFYAFARKGNELLIAAADCTGHGVPGAFMSMIGTNLFNQTINEKGIVEPASVLNELDIGIERALKQEETDNHDGMDIIVCSLNFETKRFSYAGANRPLWIMRKNEAKQIGDGEIYGKFMHIIKPDKHPIGGFHQSLREPFTNHEIDFNPGDTLYLFTDGYSDQFGGDLGKKLLSKRFRDYLIEIKDYPINQQEGLLDVYFENWRKQHEQVDDVLVIGIRYPE